MGDGSELTCFDGVGNFSALVPSSALVMYEVQIFAGIVPPVMSLLTPPHRPRPSSS